MEFCNTSDGYTFCTKPKPIAQDLMELCIVQTAEPFREYFAITASTCNQPGSFHTILEPEKYHAACCYRMAGSALAGIYTLVSAAPSIFFKSYTEKAAVIEQSKKASELLEQRTDKEPVVLQSLALLKPANSDVEVLSALLKGCTMQHSTTKPTAKKITSSSDGLVFCAWNIDSTSKPALFTPAGSAIERCSLNGIGSKMVENPRFVTGYGEYTSVPSLSVFKMGTRLYFADSWSYYDKEFVTLVLCTKGSPCHQICKRCYSKLDPYDNPFLFRKRCYDPEPSVAVYAAVGVSVEILYCDGADVQQLVANSSEQVYFSKVRVVEK